MIDNTFSEEYRRIENILTSNNEEIFIDRENKIILTTPFLKGGDLIQDIQNINLGMSIVPENINFIIDNISIFSTNPNVQQFLPLKLKLSNKIEVEFDNVTFNKINDYKIIVDPPINLNTIQNVRFSRPRNQIYFLPDPQPDTLVYRNLVNGGDYDYLLCYDDTGGDIEYSLFVLEDTRVIDIPLVPNTAEYYIFGNGEITYLIRSQPALDTFDILRLKMDVVIDCEEDIGGTFISLRMIENIAIITYSQAIAPMVRTLRFLNIVVNDQNGNPNGIVVNRINTMIPSDQNPRPLLDFISTNRGYVFQNGNIQYFNVRNNGSIDFQDIYTFIPFDLDDDDETLAFAIGGTNLYKPHFSVLFWRIDPQIANRLIITYYHIDSILKSIKRTDFAIVKPLSIDPIIVKKYRNQLYFNTSEDIYFINLDTGIHRILNIGEQGDIIPINNIISDINATYMSTAGVTNVHPVIAPLKMNDYVRMLRWSNVRDLKSVYKLSLAYSERQFPFSYSSGLDFEFSLPNNNPISDLEIFKYVIDFRIRYSTTRLILDPLQPVKDRDPSLAIPDIEDCITSCAVDEPNKTCDVGGNCQENVLGGVKPKPKCVKKCVNKIGGVKRMLGYVSDDFNVQDFLNLYSTR